jgi:hypothetical protein
VTDARIEGVIASVLARLNDDDLRQLSRSMVVQNYDRALRNTSEQLSLSIRLVPNKSAIGFLTDYAFANVQSLKVGLAGRLRAELVQAILNRENSREIAKRVQKAFDITSAAAVRIARTESHRAYNQGARQVAKQSGLDLRKVLHNDSPECDICTALSKRDPIGVDDAWVYKGESYVNAPIHPHCTCRDMYVQADEKSEVGLKHKYLRRWRNRRGDWEYEYPEDRREHERVQEEVLDKDDGTIDDMARQLRAWADENGITFDKILQDSTALIKKKTKELMPDFSERYEKEGLLIWLAFRNDLETAALTIKTSFTHAELSTTEGLSSYNSMRKLVGVLSEVGAYGFRKDQQSVRELVSSLRARSGNDTRKINEVLKVMHVKARVKKDGWVGDSPSGAVPRTAEKIQGDASSFEVNGVRGLVSKNYLKNNTIHKKPEDLRAVVTDVLENLPAEAQRRITTGGTVIHFVSRVEMKTLLQTGRHHNSASAIYSPSNNAVYIFPPKYDDEVQRKFTMSEARLKEAGYDDALIKKLTRDSGKDILVGTITHELAHAVALNNAGGEGVVDKLQTSYDEMYARVNATLFRALQTGEADRARSEERSVTKYATTNSMEDFAETLAWYARRKSVVDAALSKNEDWIHPALKEKLEWMKKEVWQE